MLTLDEYRFWVNSRIDIYPEIVFEKLNILINNNPNIKRVWLCGSYLRGDWVDENTEDKYIRFKKEILGKKRLSDVDFVTEPRVSSTKDYDIIPDSKHKVLIYDHGKTII